MSIKKNLDEINLNIKKAAKKSDRSKDDIVVVCVTKTVKPEHIDEAIECGVNIIGENKVQEAVGKYDSVSKKVDWHLIGHLQTNKVKKAINMFSLIQSVDSENLLREINKQAAKISKVQDILIEVNLSGEESKFGFFEPAIWELFENVEKDVDSFQNIRIKGFMTMAPFTDDEKKIRSCFRKAKELFEKISDLFSSSNINMQYLSMGMSNDYVIAIEEGANMVRIGSAIFK
ncbi:YggS family pyridoxal phosphate-dependent enzyme [bacterium]